MNLNQRVTALEAQAGTRRDDVELAIAPEESVALLGESMFSPELQARRERLPARVEWSVPTPEGAEQAMRDMVIDDAAARERRRERLALADATLTRLGV